jgi:uncharacterized protein YjbI with pentapeptide repeats
MANQQHLNILKRGRDTWNKWRKEDPKIRPDLRKVSLSLINLTQFDLSFIDFDEAYLWGAYLNNADLNGANFYKANLMKADLSGASLSKVNFREVNLTGADLTGADLTGADLTGAILNEANLNRAKLNRANLSRANLKEADLSKADLSLANLNEANLSRANLSGAILRGANLSAANLNRAILNEANLSRANLSGAILIKTSLIAADITACQVYGIAVWDVILEEARQDDLVINDFSQSIITVDNLEVAQFIYLLLNNKKIRDVIDTITSKVVLILGRFTPERKAILDAIREELRKLNYSPIIFDFEKPRSRDLTETVNILAHLARFIIVDLTDPSSAPHEVATIIPQCIVPVQPLLLRDDAQPRHEYAMFHDLKARYHWVLPTYQYQDTSSLLATLKEHIIEPAEQKAKELEKQ